MSMAIWGIKLCPLRYYDVQLFLSTKIKKKQILQCICSRKKKQILQHISYIVSVEKNGFRNCVFVSMT